MSAESIHTALNRIVEDVVKLASAVLADDRVGVNVKTQPRVNTLKESRLNEELQAVLVEKVGDDPVLRALFNNYVGYIEWDRPPKYGKQPPVDELRGWAMSRGIPTDAETLWSISYAIWLDGHAGRPVFATLALWLDKEFDERWSGQLYEALLDDLNNYFK